MQLKLNLLENSLDFLQLSLKDYLIANEDECHNGYRPESFKKLNWKTAFVNLTQATELLMKYAIYQISPILLKPDIDKRNLEDKTITFMQCIQRMDNFTSVKLSVDEMDTLKNSSKIRNEFIHYKVDKSTEELKIKYSMLFSIYKRIFENTTNKKLEVNGINNSLFIEISSFADNFTFFRGFEIPKNELDTFKTSLKASQEYSNFIDKNGNTCKRIRCGTESRDETIIYDWDYCDDCGAAQGEFHSEFCDLEECPFCHSQALSCDCEVRWSK